MNLSTLSDKSPSGLPDNPPSSNLFVLLIVSGRETVVFVAMMPSIFYF